MTASPRAELEALLKEWMLLVDDPRWQILVNVWHTLPKDKLESATHTWNAHDHTAVFRTLYYLRFPVSYFANPTLLDIPFLRRQLDEAKSKRAIQQGP